MFRQSRATRSLADKMKKKLFSNALCVIYLFVSDATPGRMSGACSIPSALESKKVELV